MIIAVLDKAEKLVLGASRLAAGMPIMARMQAQVRGMRIMRPRIVIVTVVRSLLFGGFTRSGVSLPQRANSIPVKSLVAAANGLGSKQQ
jgi:hypothetical protein